MIIQIGQVSTLFRSMVLQLCEKPKKMIKEKCNINAKQCDIYLKGKKAKMASNMTIYRQKNMLQAHQISEKFCISDKMR